MIGNIFSHVDVRVRDRDRAIAFYDRLLGAMGLSREPAGVEFITYARQPQDDSVRQWFGFTVEPDMMPGKTRISFVAASRAEVDRLAEVARSAGALHFEAPHEAYGEDYYATFFEDLDGNRLEIAYVES